MFASLPSTMNDGRSDVEDTDKTSFNGIQPLCTAVLRGYREATSSFLLRAPLVVRGGRHPHMVKKFKPTEMLERELALVGPD
jgi:hypothetical protein